VLTAAAPSEKSIQNAILTAWGAHSRVRLARLNVGVGWFAAGKPARKGDPGAYPVKFGIPGMADLCGVIAPEGRLLCIEVKAAKGKQRAAQESFERIVRAFGGVYVLARSVDDVDAALAGLGLTRR
jgi:hypothetical protein